MPDTGGLDTADGADIDGDDGAAPNIHSLTNRSISSGLCDASLQEPVRALSPRRVLYSLIHTDIRHVDIPDGFKEPKTMSLSACLSLSHAFTLCIFDLALLRRSSLHVRVLDGTCDICP